MKTNIAGVIPFFKKGKDRGIREIWTAVRKGNFSAVVGRSSLVYIYYNEGEYKKSWKLNSEIYKRYPENTVCLYMRACLSEELKKWNVALDAYTVLLEHLRKSEFSSRGYEAECLGGIALCYYKLDNYDVALSYVEQPQVMIDYCDLSQELLSPLKDFEQIVYSIRELKKEILNILPD